MDKEQKVINYKNRRQKFFKRIQSMRQLAMQRNKKFPHHNKIKNKIKKRSKVVQ